MAEYSFGFGRSAQVFRHRNLTIAAESRPICYCLKLGTSGFLNDSGCAIGVLSTVQIAPPAGSNGAGDLGKELAWMHANTSFSGVQLVAGTQPFNPSLTQAIIGG